MSNMEMKKLWSSRSDKAIELHDVAAAIWVLPGRLRGRLKEAGGVVLCCRLAKWKLHGGSARNWLLHSWVSVLEVRDAEAAG